MKTLTKGLAQAWLMLIALFGFINSPTDHEIQHGSIRLVKKLSKDSDLDIVIKSPKANPDHKCQVSILNRKYLTEITKWFDNAYDAAKYFADGHVATELYNSYMRISDELIGSGPVTFELQPYFAMITTGNKREFMTVDAVNTSDATEQIKNKIIELLSLTSKEDQAKIDVKIMNSIDAKAFAGYIMTT